MTKRYTPWGYGDEPTWPPYSGHPNDPRAPDDVEEEDEEPEPEDEEDE